jgi:phytoene dehydrogenase-like protein
MTATVARRAPEIAAATRAVMTGSPRTFERFTGRTGGFVGGSPRRAGLANYRTLGPTEAAPGLFLVGDSVFPGQSTLATALGGQRAAVAALRRLGRSGGA